VKKRTKAGAANDASELVHPGEKWRHIPQYRERNSMLDKLKDILQFLFQCAIKLGESGKTEKRCEN